MIFDIFDDSFEPPFLQCPDLPLCGPWFVRGALQQIGRPHDLAGALTIDMHHAGPAEAAAAAKLGAVKFEFCRITHSSGVSSGASQLLSSPSIFSVARLVSCWLVPRVNVAGRSAIRLPLAAVTIYNRGQ